MNKIQIIIIGVTAILAFTGIIVFLQSLNIGGANSVSIKDAQPVYAGEGETCSTSTFKIGCQSGLICATKEFKSDFNPNLETAKCINETLIVDKGSHLWSKN